MKVLSFLRNLLDRLDLLPVPKEKVRQSLNDYDEASRKLMAELKAPPKPFGISLSEAMEGARLDVWLREKARMKQKDRE